jgi:hypothetical protein
MTRVLFIIIIISFNSLLIAQVENISLLPDSNYPLWLKTKQARTDQTSGIAFIKSECNVKYFFLADDIGAIHLLKIKDDTLFTISNISFSDSVQQFIDKLPKADFEEIIHDKNEDEYYLSIEGNGKDFKKYVGIYKIDFEGSQIENYKIASLQKIIFTPQEKFLQFTDFNIGYEGVAIDKNYFYLGLEGFIKNRLFADSTLIFIARKSDKEIIKEISTKNIGVHTISGLFSDENYSLWGIDRNNRKIFHINFDEKLNTKTFSKYDCLTVIPSYPELNYLSSFESITIDDENNLYLVDDPWKEMFLPEQEILDKLDIETNDNFKEYIPTIFKYKIIHPEGDK